MMADFANNTFSHLSFKVLHYRIPFLITVLVQQSKLGQKPITITKSPLSLHDVTVCNFSLEQVCVLVLEKYEFNVLNNLVLYI